MSLQRRRRLTRAAAAEDTDSPTHSLSHSLEIAFPQSPHDALPLLAPLWTFPLPALSTLACCKGGTELPALLGGSRVGDLWDRIASLVAILLVCNKILLGCEVGLYTLEV